MKNLPLVPEQIANIELHILSMLPMIGLDGHQVWAEGMPNPNTYEMEPCGVITELVLHEDSHIFIGNSANLDPKTPYVVYVQLKGDTVFEMEYENLANALSAFWAQLSEFINNN